MKEYIIEWSGIGARITELMGSETPCLAVKHLRKERRREPIVRCRDCIYYKPDPEPIDPGWPMMCERTGDDMVEPYGFCAWGERKEKKPTDAVREFAERYEKRIAELEKQIEEKGKKGND